MIYTFKATQGCNGYYSIEGTVELMGDTYESRVEELTELIKKEEVDDICCEVENISPDDFTQINCYKYSAFFNKVSEIVNLEESEHTMIVKIKEHIKMTTSLFEHHDIEIYEIEKQI